MKLICFTDMHGNEASYRLSIPDSMTEWRLENLQEYARLGFEESHRAGYLPLPGDCSRFESLRALLCRPDSTLNRPIVLNQNGCTVTENQAIQLMDKVNYIYLDRDINAPAPGPDAVDLTGRHLDALHSFHYRVVELVDGLFDFTAFPITDRSGKQIRSFEGLTGKLADRLDAENCIRFLYRLAAVIHLAPFENYSKLKAGIPFRSGLGMLQNIHAGFGGVCVEKTAALRFICDIAGLNHRPVLGSSEDIPENIDEMVFNFAASGGETELPVWIQHHIIEVEVGGEWYLIDVTNGNIPFLFLNQTDSAATLKNGARARMVYKTERVNYRRAARKTGDILMTVSEFHIPEMQEDYIFQQELGLMISDHLYIGVFYDYGDERSAQMQTVFSRRAASARYPYPRFIHGSNLDALPDANLQEILRSALDRLRNTAGLRGYSGDFTFVIQPLPECFWRMPRVSAPVRQSVIRWMKE